MLLSRCFLILLVRLGCSGQEGGAQAEPLLTGDHPEGWHVQSAVYFNPVSTASWTAVVARGRYRFDCTQALPESDDVTCWCAAEEGSPQAAS